MLNAQDVAYCAEIYNVRKGKGKRIFNPDGTPYTPKTGPLSPEPSVTILEEKPIQEDKLIEMPVTE